MFLPSCDMSASRNRRWFTVSVFSWYGVFTGSPGDATNSTRHATESVASSSKFIIGAVLVRDGLRYLSGVLVVLSHHQVDAKNIFFQLF